MAQVPTPTTTEISIQGTGSRTRSREMALSKCQQETSTEEAGGWAKSKGKEFIYSPTAMSTKVLLE